MAIAEWSKIIEICCFDTNCWPLRKWLLWFYCTLIAPRCTIIFLIHSFADGHLGCFQHLAIVNCAAMNIGVHRFFWIGVSGLLGYTPSSGITGSKGSSTFSFLRKFHTVFHSGFTSLPSHQQCTEKTFSFYPASLEILPHGKK